MKLTLLKRCIVYSFPVLIGMTFSAKAQVKVYENFEYTAGQDLSTQNGGLGFAGPWSGSKDNSGAAGGGSAKINAANLDGNTLGGSADLGGQWTERYRKLNGSISNTAGTTLWIAFSYKVTADQEYSGLSLFNGQQETVYIGKVDKNSGDKNYIGLGGGYPSSAAATAGGATQDQVGVVKTNDIHYYLAKINFLGVSDLKVTLWADYTGTTEPMESDLTKQAVSFYNAASGITQIRIAGSCPDAGAFANFDGLRLSSTFFTKSNITLPVTLVSFTAAEKNNGNSLVWKTSSEINTVKFIVERKEANGTFKEIETVASSKNPNGSTYQAYDANPFIGNNAYRLKIVDADGTFTYSTIINISSTSSGAAVSIYPNPVSNGIVNVVAGNEPIKSISVINITGARLMTINVQSAYRNVPVNVGSLSKGVYILEIVSPASVVRKQVVIN